MHVPWLDQAVDRDIPVRFNGKAGLRILEQESDKFNGAPIPGPIEPARKLGIENKILPPV